MKKKSKKKATNKKVATRVKSALRRAPARKAVIAKAMGGRDDQALQEFEQRDLGDDLRKSSAGKVIYPPRARPTSLYLEQDLIDKLRVKGSKRGLGYQTMLKMIVREHLHEY